MGLAPVAAMSQLGAGGGPKRRRRATARRAIGRIRGATTLDPEAVARALTRQARLSDDGHLPSLFDLGNLRDLPDLKALAEVGLLVRAAPPQAAQDALDRMLEVPAHDEGQGPEDFQGRGIDE